MLTMPFLGALQFINLMLSASPWQAFVDNIHNPQGLNMLAQHATVLTDEERNELLKLWFQDPMRSYQNRPGEFIQISRDVIQCYNNRGFETAVIRYLIAKGRNSIHPQMAIDIANAIIPYIKCVEDIPDVFHPMIYMHHDILRIIRDQVSRNTSPL